MSAGGRPLRVAVVGAGVMGRYHALNYAMLPGVELSAVVDPNPAARHAAVASFGCRAYASLDELLVAERVEAATVASPTSDHYATTRRLLSEGVHVLVEKPVATEVGLANELARLSRSHGLVLQVGHITRFYQSVQLLKLMVGTPFLIEARRTTNSSRVKDVGVILDLMIHDIDIVLSLVASRPRELSAAGLALNGSQHEDVASAQIVFENGCVVRLLASRVAPEPERNLSVTERHQSVSVDFAKEPYTELVVYRTPDLVVEPGLVQLDRHVLQEENPLLKELGHFAARIRQEAEPIGTLDDDLRSLSLASELLAKVRSHMGAPV